MSKSDKITNLLKNTFLTAVLVVLGLTAIFLLDTTTSGPFVFTKSVPTNYSPPTTTLFFAGDIMLSRNVGLAMIKNQDFTYPFRSVSEIIKQADLAFANLESPFSEQGPYGQQGLTFKSQPESIEGLLSAGLDILSTANNHSFDLGQKAADFTYKWLRQNNIYPVGGGSNCHEGVVIEKNNTKFGFLAYSYSAHNDGGRLAEPWVCDWKDVNQTAEDIQTLKTQADFVIVSAHTGTEYQREPDEIDVARAHSAIDSGADLFIGHHPHWIQTIEQYQDKWIFYSLGNFVFDQMWSQETREGLTVLMELKNDKINSIELRPVVIEDYCCPRWADEDESLAILKKINLTSPILIDKND